MLYLRAIDRTLLLDPILPPWLPAHLLKGIECSNWMNVYHICVFVTEIRLEFVELFYVFASL